MKIWDVVANRYGSKRGFLAFVSGQIALFLGVYKRMQSPDWSRVQRLVFVCHGNICRSAMGDAIARKHNVSSVSCGLHACPGRPADSRAIQFGENHQIDLIGHQSTHIDQVAFQKTDLVVAMEPAHIKALSGRVGEAQVTLLGLWLPAPLAYLHDPYSTSPLYFERCMLIVELATVRLATHLL